MRPLSLNKPLIISAVAIIAATIVIATQLSALAVAMFTARPEGDPTSDRLASYLEAHDEDLAAYRDRIDGRSIFFKPQPPRRPRTPVVRKDPDLPQPPAPPPSPPRNYTGPSVLFVLGDEVWFRNGPTLRVGESGDGITVIESNAPWSVKLDYAGKTYDIELFKRNHPGLSSAPPRVQAHTPGLKVVEAPRDEATAEVQDAVPTEQQ